MLVGVNGLLALEAIDKDLLNGLLQKAIKLEGSGVSCQWGTASDTATLHDHHQQQQQAGAAAQCPVTT